MNHRAECGTIKELHYEILAVFESEFSRYIPIAIYHGPREYWWRCLICGECIECREASAMISHLYNKHDISPVQTGFSWIGRPIEKQRPESFSVGTVQYY